jgi:hypothetical protein
MSQMGHVTVGNVPLETLPILLLLFSPPPLMVDTGLDWGDFGGVRFGRPSFGIAPGGTKVDWDAAVPGGGPN